MQREKETKLKTHCQYVRKADDTVPHTSLLCILQSCVVCH